MNKKDVWVESGWYDCCSGYWMVTYTLYEEDGESIVDSCSSEEGIELYYYLKQPNTSYDSWCEKQETNTLPSFSHLYEVEYDRSIDHTMNWTCYDD